MDNLSHFHSLYYFSRTENKVELADKVQRLALWIDRVDFLKTFNNTFVYGFSTRKLATCHLVSLRLPLLVSLRLNLPIAYDLKRRK